MDISKFIRRSILDIICIIPPVICAVSEYFQDVREDTKVCWVLSLTSVSSSSVGLGVLPLQRCLPHGTKSLLSGIFQLAAGVSIMNASSIHTYQSYQSGQGISDVYFYAAWTSCGLSFINSVLYLLEWKKAG
ncbi:UNVERIFIED_CONTAM: hypothetical protein FKN15_007218 [Acipenser sinensis]